MPCPSHLFKMSPVQNLLFVLRWTSCKVEWKSCPQQRASSSQPPCSSEKPSRACTLSRSERILSLYNMKFIRADHSSFALNLQCIRFYVDWFCNFTIKSLIVVLPLNVSQTTSDTDTLRTLCDQQKPQIGYKDLMKGYENQVNTLAGSKDKKTEVSLVVNLFQSMLDGFIRGELKRVESEPVKVISVRL